MNGNGGGKAVGKPCAGCVGKADNKNPKGQMPNGSDHNAGYECDTNHGVGRTNPAHTGCQSAPPECVPTPTVPCVPTPPECVPTPTVPCVPTPPECVPTPTVPCVPTPPVSPPVVSPPVVSPPQSAPIAAAPAPSQAVSAPAAVMPNTGAPADLAWLAAAALASILVGAGLLLRGRKQTA